MTKSAQILKLLNWLKWNKNKLKLLCTPKCYRKRKETVVSLFILSHMAPFSYSYIYSVVSSPKNPQVCFHDTIILGYVYEPYKTVMYTFSVGLKKKFPTHQWRNVQGHHSRLRGWPCRGQTSTTIPQPTPLSPTAGNKSETNQEHVRKKITSHCFGDLYWYLLKFCTVYLVSNAWMQGLTLRTGYFSHHCHWKDNLD